MKMLESTKGTCRIVLNKIQNALNPPILSALSISSKDRADVSVSDKNTKQNELPHFSIQVLYLDIFIFIFFVSSNNNEEKTLSTFKILKVFSRLSFFLKLTS